ncbi:MAG: hypothetical protein IPJ38_06365 [Dechloromonas sp.]|uniref:Uncharacterized protein n=1 Tax=Candidatus Dechloromonas phosphorivorans TaxID=2899244 RepID=A0A935K8R8_9RHOO|nr:hypothetical protein [Candidatus Dechloromonas phosphorivorans]
MQTTFSVLVQGAFFVPVGETRQFILISENRHAAAMSRSNCAIEFLG